MQAVKKIYHASFTRIFYTTCKKDYAFSGESIRCWSPLLLDYLETKSNTENKKPQTMRMNWCFHSKTHCLEQKSISRWIQVQILRIIGPSENIVLPARLRLFWHLFASMRFANAFPEKLAAPHVEKSKTNQFDMRCQRDDTKYQHRNLICWYWRILYVLVTWL